MESILKINVDNSEIISLINELKDLVYEHKKSEKLVYTTAELAEALSFRKQTARIDQLRRCGALTAIKKGTSYIFTREEVDKFLKDFNGYDLSNEKAIVQAVKEVRLKIKKC